MILEAIISPSVLACDLSNLSGQVEFILNQGANWCHMDIMDGHFVPNITLGPPVLKSLHKNHPDLFMDCHMMVSDPAKWIHDVADAGAKSYTFHYEACSSTDQVLSIIQQIRSTGMRAAVAISPDTLSSVITDAIGEAVDMILVMTVYPGKGGQKFISSCVPKIAQLRERFPTTDIQVDGGIALGESISCCARAGSNVIVAGTSLFTAHDPKSAIQEMKQVIEVARASWNTSSVEQENKAKS